MGKHFSIQIPFASIAAGVVWEGAKLATEVADVVELGQKVVDACKGDKGMV